MSKNELISQVAEKLQISKASAAAKVQAVFDEIVSMTVQKGEFRYPGFGTFKVRERKAREVRNPQNGKKMQVPASKTPVFVASKVFKETVNA